jgi:serine/threonine-protein kinase PknG
MKCQRNCPGTIEDGYCDTCGLAPLKVPAGSTAGSARTAGSGRAATASVRTAPLSTRTGGSSRTGSGRTGSRRRRFGGGLVDVAPIT